MNQLAVERARMLITEARNGHAENSDTAAAHEHSRMKVEALERVTSDLVAALPEQVGAAVQEGFRREVLPVGRTLAEIRGLLNQANRRLERLEAAVTAERDARLDDISLVVDLVTSGWRNVDERLRRVESQLVGEHVPLHGEVVVRAYAANGTSAASSDDHT